MAAKAPLPDSLCQPDTRVKPVKANTPATAEISQAQFIDQSKTSSWRRLIRIIFYKNRLKGSCLHPFPLLPSGLDWSPTAFTVVLDVAKAFFWPGRVALFARSNIR